ncbi:MAG: 4-hydroxy-3-methylbut-2-enyl diphosphate reductase [Candidatus Omnitrophota bacterium]
MEINLARSAGFCSGVKRALKIALAQARSGKKVYMLGDIVHNEDVVKQMKRLGIKKVKKMSRGKNKLFLIRAHGAPQRIFQLAQKHGFEIIDATCPMVKEIHRIAREMENKGYAIIIIGDSQHDEVAGIKGQLKKKALVINTLQGLKPERLKQIKKAAVVVQSTQNLENTERIVCFLEKHIQKLQFFNTICQPTKTKQAEIKQLPLENEIVVVIGSKTSANTRRLYEISKVLNPQTYWVRSEQELRREWFRGAKSVGVTAGASTPHSTIISVVNQIRRYAPAGD